MATFYLGKTGYGEQVPQRLHSRVALHFRFIILQYNSENNYCQVYTPPWIPLSDITGSDKLYGGALLFIHILFSFLEGIFVGLA